MYCRYVIKINGLTSSVDFSFDLLATTCGEASANDFLGDAE